MLYQKAKEIPCQICSGHYMIAAMQFGTFGRCSNYPNCTSTISVVDLVALFFQKNGIKLYSWERECWKCKRKTRVCTYFLNVQLSELNPYFLTNCKMIGLGDLPNIDNVLENRYTTIKTCYSKTVESDYVANICQHCGGLQGKNFVVDDPHEIIEDLFCDDAYIKMEHYKVGTIMASNLYQVLRQDLMK